MYFARLSICFLFTRNVHDSAYAAQCPPLFSLGVRGAACVVPTTAESTTTVSLR